MKTADNKIRAASVVRKSAILILDYRIELTSFRRLTQSDKKLFLVFLLYCGELEFAR
jgi:hypothetical protein